MSSKKLTVLLSLLLFFILSLGLGGCLTHETRLLQNQFGPQAADTRAQPSLIDGYWFSTKAVSPNFGLSMNVSLGNQLANREDLVKPKKLGKPNPMSTVGAVERYQKDQVKALSDISLEAGGQSSNAE
jgi:hypothetical protein